jgi:hypothetical protein
VLRKLHKGRGNELPKEFDLTEVGCIIAMESCLQILSSEYLRHVSIAPAAPRASLNLGLGVPKESEQAACAEMNECPTLLSADILALRLHVTFAFPLLWNFGRAIDRFAPGAAIP